MLEKQKIIKEVQENLQRLYTDKDTYQVAKARTRVRSFLRRVEKMYGASFNQYILWFVLSGAKVPDSLTEAHLDFPGKFSIRSFIRKLMEEKIVRETRGVIKRVYTYTSKEDFRRVLALHAEIVVFLEDTERKYSEARKCLMWHILAQSTVKSWEAFDLPGNLVERFVQKLGKSLESPPKAPKE